MTSEKLIEKLLNEGLELLSSEKEQKQKQGFYSLRAAFGLGSMEAAYYGGICYQNGTGIYQSDEQAFNHFHMAANAVPKAMYELGLCYVNGTGTEQNVDKAFECFTHAAQSGVPEAQYELGVCYRCGEGTEPDLKAAMYWYEKAADQGYLRAYQNMGVVYQHGFDDIPLDYVKAFNCFKKAAEEESPDAYFCVGNCYLQGLGVEKNETEATFWFKKAADMGEPDSMFHLAWMYQNGIGVEQNDELSTDYLYKAAEAGWEPAIKIIEGED